MGTFIAALAVVEIVRFAVRGGLGGSLSRAERVTPLLADTVFWGQTLLGLMAAFACVALRHPLASIVGTPQAAPFIAALGFTAPLSAVGATHLMQALRKSGSRVANVRAIGAGAAGGMVALAAVGAGWGVWALVVQRLAGEAFGALFAWFAFRWRPGARLSWAILLREWWLGSVFAGSQVMSALLDRVQDIVLGVGLGPAAIGLYRAAGKSIEVAAIGALTPLCALLFDRRRDPPPGADPPGVDLPAADQLRARHLRVMAGGAMVALPAITCLGVVADSMVPLLLGRHWGQCVPLVRILSLLGPHFVVRFFADPISPSARGAADMAGLAGIELGLLLAFLTLAVPHGLAWFAFAYVAQAYLMLVPRLALLQRETGVRAVDIVGAMGPAMAASAIMAIVVWGTGDTMPSEGSSAAMARIAFLMVQGFLVYVAVLIAILYLTRREDMVRLLRGMKVLCVQ